ncbi:MAG: hypothetical protein JSW40_06050 [Candidatus Omnitrophota bacterium]|nr:MAG: hypothetical protein JSW40_06050 [Candidatus Omnitrophota bacterium]
MRKSITLTEVIVGAIIIASVFAGLLASFIAVRRYVAHANRRLIALNLSRTVINGLFEDVDQSRWAPGSGGGLEPGDHDVDSFRIENVFFEGNYTVTQPAGHEYREMEIRIQYDEEGEPPTTGG